MIFSEKYGQYKVENMSEDTIKKQAEIFEQIKDTCISYGEARRLAAFMSKKSDKDIKDFIERRKN